MPVAETLFPILSPPVSPATAPAGLPLYRDIAWDFEADRPRFRDGAPVYVEGLEAVAVWAQNAARTERFRHEIFSTDYGCELTALVGQPYSEDTKLAQAGRYVRDALLVSPYITAVSVAEASFSEGRLSLRCRIMTVYGEVDLDV